MQSDKTFDIIIIGGGVVGCAIARHLSKYKLDILLLEKEADVASEISKANSGVLHAGFNVPPGTLKAKTNVKGYHYFHQLQNELNFKMKINEKLVVAKNDEEREHLESLYKQGQQNNVEGLELVGEEQINRMEPRIDAKYALHSTITGIILPYEFTIALAENAHKNGVDFSFRSKVIDINKSTNRFRVLTQDGTEYKSRWVINSAGIFADKVSEMLTEIGESVYPCRGEYYITDKAEGVIDRMIYPVPPTDGSGLGVHLTPTVEGNILIGPSANFIDDRTDTSNTREYMEILKNEGKELLPALENTNFIRNYAGIRPKLWGQETDEDFADFVIRENEEVSHFIELLGIESPGLTAAPEIANIVKNIIGESEELEEDKSFNPHRESTTRFAGLSSTEQAELIEEDERYGTIFCRCETVTKKEVMEAIENPLGVKTLDGIKKRCRAMMGRCQGGFCTPRIIRLLIDEYGISPDRIYKNNPKSQIFDGLIKD